jgi:hypothetical protein
LLFRHPVGELTGRVDLEEWGSRGGH